MSEIHQIRSELRSLIQEAERRGKWLHCAYQDLWFSPAELRKANDESKFLWGAVNWTLRDPIELLEQARRRVKLAEEEYRRIEERIFGASHE